MDRGGGGEPGSGPRAGSATARPGSPRSSPTSATPGGQHRWTAAPSCSSLARTIRSAIPCTCKPRKGRSMPGKPTRKSPSEASPLPPSCRSRAMSRSALARTRSYRAASATGTPPTRCTRYASRCPQWPASTRPTPPWTGTGSSSATGIRRPTQAPTTACAMLLALTTVRPHLEHGRRRLRRSPPQLRRLAHRPLRAPHHRGGQHHG